MRFAWLILALILSACGQLPVNGTTAPRRSEYQPVGPTSDEVAFIGDSITAGEDWNREFPTARNYGVPGDRTDQILARVYAIVESNPKTALIMGGVNDYDAELPVARTIENLRTMIELFHAKSPGTRVILESCLPTPRTDIRVYNSAIRALAEEQGIEYLDLYPAYEGHPEFFRDGTHPIFPSGYIAWVDQLRPYLHQP